MRVLAKKMANAVALQSGERVNIRPRGKSVVG
jgi:hypothetical protein